MDFPSDRLGFTTKHGTEESEAGWLVLNVQNVDLEGVNRIYVDLRDLEQIKARSTKKEAAAERARELFGV